MSVRARLAAFAVALAAVFGGGWALGVAVGPDAVSHDGGEHR